MPFASARRVRSRENDSNENRARNRRVEFVIVGGAGNEHQSSGPGTDTLDKR